ncbi:MAG: hypothetical protein RRC34_16745 [Lentisphaeria bacterium]|nr:hypothetical protein [Lentisphaeria bacterium]
MNRSIRHTFTIIELIVVTFIIGIVLTLTLAPFDKLVTVAGVDGAVNMISSQLRACRQHAVGKRAQVALAIYRDGMTQAIRTAQLDKDNHFDRWTESSTWAFLPAGAVVEEVDDGDSATSGDTDDGGVDITLTADQMVPISTTAVTCRFIIYRPTGKLDGGHSPVIKVSDAIPDGSGGYTTPGKRGMNYLKLTVNRFTGQITITEP